MNNFNKQKTFSINDILKVLPHRYPFILIDKVNTPTLVIVAKVLISRSACFVMVVKYYIIFWLLHPFL